MTHEVRIVAIVTAGALAGIAALALAINRLGLEAWLALP